MRWSLSDRLRCGWRRRHTGARSLEVLRTQVLDESKGFLFKKTLLFSSNSSKPKYHCTELWLFSKRRPEPPTNSPSTVDDSKRLMVSDATISFGNEREDQGTEAAKGAKNDLQDIRILGVCRAFSRSVHSATLTCVIRSHEFMYI